MSNIKRLKFSEPAPTAILLGKKNTTWRINDEKELEEGDEISLCYNNGEEFAKAIITRVKQNSLEDKTFEHEMYTSFFKDSQKEITPESKLKIITFELIKNQQ